MRVAVALFLVAALATAARAAGGDEERARGHYEIGLGLYRLGDYRAALKEFAAGYELAHKPGFLLNLGQTYRKLGELREARDMYRQFLAEVQPDDPARPQAHRVLAELEAAIRAQPPAPKPAQPPSPKLALTPSPKPAQPPPPKLAQPPSPKLALTPSPKPAQPPSQKPVLTPTPDVEPVGKPRVDDTSDAAAPLPDAAPPIAPPPVAATMAPPPAPPAAATTVQASSPRPSRRALRIAGVTVAAVGIGLLGAGIGTAVAADREARDLNALDASGGAFDPAKDRAWSLDRGLSIGFFAGGAIAAATGVVLVVVGRR